MDSIFNEMCGGDCSCNTNISNDADIYNDNEKEGANMSKSDLFNIIENATMLQEMLTDDYPLEDWVEAKITKAADYIRSVFQYLKYEVSKKEQGDFSNSGSPVKVYVATNPQTLGIENVNEKKLCKRGKSAAKAKFDVYPSAYANAYASKVCAGKAKDHKGKKQRNWSKKGK